METTGETADEGTSATAGGSGEYDYSGDQYALLTTQEKDTLTVEQQVLLIQLRVDEKCKGCKSCPAKGKALGCRTKCKDCKLKKKKTKTSPSSGEKQVGVDSEFRVN